MNFVMVCILCCLTVITVDEDVVRKIRSRRKRLALLLFLTGVSAGILCLVIADMVQIPRWEKDEAIVLFVGLKAGFVWLAVRTVLRGRKEIIKITLYRYK